MNGILLVDKPRGPTSHDVVARVRRALGTKSVGHAGTLDPMASGLLVLGIDEGTKLLAAYDEHDKRYVTRVAFGSETDTLDAEGAVLDTRTPPYGIDLERARATARTFLGRIEQAAPVFSAIKRDGVPLHVRARRGEVMEAPIREVLVHAIEVETADDTGASLALHVGKGFYVRSFGRDFARALGTVGHLTDLRRTASGPFVVAGAIHADELTRENREAIVERLLDLPSACLGFPRLVLEPAAAAHVRHGRPLPLALLPGAEALAEGGRAALLVATGELLALGVRAGDALTIARGFVEGQAAYDRMRQETATCSE